MNDVPENTVKPAASYALVLGEKSVFAAQIERYMQSKGLKVIPNDVISAEEHQALTKHLQGLIKDKSSGLTGQISFAADGAISFTARALALLEIQLPKK